MIDSTQRLNFAIEAGLRLRAHPCQDFECNLPAQRRLPGAIDDAHAALTELREELELAYGALAPFIRRLGRLDRRIRGMRDRFARLRPVGRDFQHAGQHFAWFAARIGLFGMQTRRIAQVIGLPLAGPAANEEHLLGVRLVHHQRMECSHAFDGRSRAGDLESQALSIRQTGGRRAGKLQRVEAAGLLPQHLEAFDVPVSGDLPHVGDVEQPPAGQKIDPAEQLAQPRQQRAGHFLVDVVGQLTGCGVGDDFVAVRHQVIEQILQPHGGLAALLFLAQRFHEGRVEAGHARQVVACSAQEPFGKLTVPLVAAHGQRRHQQSRQFPPLPKMRPRQVFQTFDNLGIGICLFGVFDDGRRSQQQQGGFPQIEGGQVSFQRIDRAIRAAIELRKGQRKTSDQVLVKNRSFIHDARRRSVWRKVGVKSRRQAGIGWG